MGRRVRGSTAALVAGASLCLVPGSLFVPWSGASLSRPRVAAVGTNSHFTSPASPAPRGDGSFVALVGFAATAAAVCAGRVPRSAEPAEAPATPEKEADTKAASSTAAPAEEPAPESSEEKAAEKETSEEAPIGFDITKQVGATAPLGFWDPANLCKGDETKFRTYRTAELKHGRVAMMAAVGAVFQHFVTFPGFGDVPRGIEAISSGLGTIGFIALIGLAGYLETGKFKQEKGKEPGDFGDPLGLVEKNIGQFDDEWRNREINNGRFAMFAAIGIIAAENETGLDAVEQIFGL